MEGIIMKKIIFILLIGVIGLLSACDFTNRDAEDYSNGSIEESNVTENIFEKNELSFESYTGIWTDNGKTHYEIISEGGVELSCEITKNNQFVGKLFVQQTLTERFAGIENISGKIEQNEIFFDYSDDEWGNSGTLHIQFRDESIYLEILNYCESDGGSDFGIGGTYELIKENVTDNSITYSDAEPKNTEDIINARSQYYIASAYYSEIMDYWENTREVRDVSNVMEPLFYTDKQYYTEKDFENEPALVIYLAKNEIYARHGYIFKNGDLYNYFMGCVWYHPTCGAEEFNESVLNEYEKANLKILVSMDTFYKRYGGEL